MRRISMSQISLPFGVSAAACIPSPGCNCDTSFVTRPLSASTALGPRNVLHWPAHSNHADSRRRSRYASASCADSGSGYTSAGATGAGAAGTGATAGGVGLRIPGEISSELDNGTPQKDTGQKQAEKATENQPLEATCAVRTPCDWSRRIHAQTRRSRCPPRRRRAARAARPVDRGAHSWPGNWHATSGHQASAARRRNNAQTS